MANQIVAGELYESITGQLFEIGRQLRQPSGYPYNPAELRKALQDAIEGRFENVVTTEAAPPTRRVSSVADIDLAKAYEALGLATEYEQYLAGLGEVVGDEQYWYLHVLPGVTPNKIVAAFRTLGVTVYTYVDDLDGGVPTNDRDANKTGSYSIRFKRTIEADPENANKSANDRVGKTDITLTERLLLELGYFLATGKHLDVKNITLCAGSRRSDDLVPSVSWYADDRTLCVYWYSPGHRRPRLRARTAVAA